MGNRSTKSSLRNAIIFLNISATNIELDNQQFWEQIWTEDQTTAADIIRSIRTEEIRMLRDGSSGNFAALTYKMLEKLYLSTGTLCNSYSQQTAVLNSVRILIRLIPCIFEEQDWRSFFSDNELDEKTVSSSCRLRYPDRSGKITNFTSYLPRGIGSTVGDIENKDFPDESRTGSSVISAVPLIHFDDATDSRRLPEKNSQLEQSEFNHTWSDKSLMRRLIDATCDLLFCPEFTVPPRSYLANVIDAPPEDIRSLSTFDYVWEPGVGYESSANSTTSYDKTRTELLRLLLTCFSAIMYEKPDGCKPVTNPWLELFTSRQNRHTLPLFTSLLNTVFSYKPNRISLANLIFEDSREGLVEISSQLLCTCLDHSSEDNMFIEYLIRIHRDEDLGFLVEGMSRLLSSGLDQSYLISSTKQVNFSVELMLLLLRMCQMNKKFLIQLLKSSEALTILVALLYHMNENFQDTTKTAKIHLSVFNLLVLSGERNFGVRLNKPCTGNYLSNLPSNSGSHADLLILVIHKLILYGENIYQLFDYLLTVLANVSPYLKNLTILSCKCLVQLFEIFSSPYVVLTEPNYHSVVLFLTEIFNNLIQYQLASNTNLVYIIVSKRCVFKDMAALTTTKTGIQRVLRRLSKRKHHIELSATNKERSEVNGLGEGFDRLKSIMSKPNAILMSESSIQQGGSIPSGVLLAATPNISQVVFLTHPFDSSDTSQSGSKSNRKNEVTSSNGAMCNDTSTIANHLGEEESDQSQSSANTSNLGSCGSWKPTPEWVINWKKTLPLASTLRMIEVLAPQLDSLGFPTMTQVEQLETTVKLLDSGTLVGLLPIPHAISIRKFKPNEQFEIWLRTCTWAAIYIQSSVWLNTSIRLIKPL